jgi:hypothetical protein
MRGPGARLPIRKDAKGTVIRVNRGCAVVALVMAWAAFLFVGCGKDHYLDTLPLQKAGMNYDAIKQIQAMRASDAEVAEAAKARAGGLSDATCVELLQLARSAQEPRFGEAAVNLTQSGMTEKDILAIAQLGQLKDGAGELQAMRLTGVSDAVLIEVATRHSEGKAALSGASLAKLKDSGVKEQTLCELVRRGLRDDQVATIAAMKARRASDADILRRFSTT